MTETLIALAIIIGIFAAGLFAVFVVSVWERFEERIIERRNIRRVSDYLDHRPW